VIDVKVLKLDNKFTREPMGSKVGSLMLFTLMLMI